MGGYAGSHEKDRLRRNAFECSQVEVDAIGTPDVGRGGGRRKILIGEESVSEGFCFRTTSQFIRVIIIDRAL